MSTEAAPAIAHDEVVTGVVAAASQVAGSAERLSATARAVDSSAHETLDLSRSATSEVETVREMLDAVSAATHQMTSTAAATGRITQGIRRVESVAVGTSEDADALTDAARNIAEVARELAVQVGTGRGYH